jgi:hypothetical protein
MPNVIERALGGPNQSTPIILPLFKKLVISGL